MTVLIYEIAALLFVMQL